MHRIFVEFARPHAGNEQFPDATRAALLHHMLRTIPLVERADYRNALRIRRPHREPRASNAFTHSSLGT